MKTNLPEALIKRKKYVQTIIRNKVLPTARNFLPLTYDMKEAVLGNIVGVKSMYVYMPIDTSNMSVLSILEAEEKIIKERKKGSLKVVSEEERDKMMAVTLAFDLLLMEHEVRDTLGTDKEKIEFLMSHYPELNELLEHDLEECKYYGG